MKRITKYTLMVAAFVLCLGASACSQDDDPDKVNSKDVPQNERTEENRPVGETVRYNYNIEYRIDGQTDYKNISGEMLDASLSLDSPAEGKRVYRFRSTDGSPLKCVNVVIEPNDGSSKIIGWPENGAVSLAGNLDVNVVSPNEFTITFDMNPTAYTGLAKFEIDCLPFQVVDSWLGTTKPFALPENVPSIQPYHPIVFLHY